MYCVYELTDPRKGGKVFYVGKGLVDRPTAHMYEFAEWDRKGRPGRFHKGRNLHKLRTIAQIVDAGMEPGVKVQSCEDEKSALKLEVARIASIGLENLTNLTAGGDGVSPSEETREKMRKAKLGKKSNWDPKERGKVWRKRWAQMSDEERREHMKPMHLARDRMTDEQKKKRAQKAQGTKERNGNDRWSSEQKESQSRRVKEWWADPDNRKRMMEARQKAKEKRSNG